MTVMIIGNCCLYGWLRMNCRWRLERRSPAVPVPLNLCSGRKAEKCAVGVELLDCGANGLNGKTKHDEFGHGGVDCHAFRTDEEIGG